MTRDYSKPANAGSRASRAVPLVLGLAGALSLSTAVIPEFMGAKQALAQSPAQTINIAQSGGFADLVDRVRPSVVSVRVTTKSPARGRRGFRRDPDLRDLPRGHPFRDFMEQFRGRPDGRTFRRRPRRASMGSGFFISEDGYIVTNQHVINNHTRVTITTHDGKKFQAKVVGADKRTDLALLKVDAKRTFQPVKFAKTEARVGDWVVAVGNPFGLGGTVTTGIISARGRELGSRSYGDYLQIDAAINRGNSGGPAFNLQGEVIGVNTAIFSPNGGSVGIGFAIPARVASDVIADLKSDGKVARGWLGVSIQPVTEDIAESLGLDGAQGAMVVQVMKDSPAAKAGIKVRDTILELNGKEVRGPRDLARKIARLRAGADAELNILRNGKRMTRSVSIAALPGADKLAGLQSRPKAKRTVARLGLELRADRQGDAVMITDVDPDSVAAEKGLRPGDRIVEVGGQPVATPRDVRRQLDRLVDKGQKAVLMLIKSQRGERFVALRLKRI